MPIYEYACQSCQHRFEVKQRFSDVPVAACSRCGQPVTKVISAPAIMFKGSGWYVTDYSDKFKAPGQSDAGSTPANGQGEQQSAAGSKSDSTTTPSSGLSGSDSTGPAKAPSTSSSTAPATTPSAPPAASTSGKTSN